MVNNNYSRQYETSPSFRWTNGSSISSGADPVNVSWESQDTNSKKYLPFNFTRIVNNGEDDINFYPNQDLNSPILVPKGTIITLDRQSLPALSTFAIENAGSTTITASKIVVNNFREGVDGLSIVQKLHKRLLGGMI